MNWNWLWVNKSIDLYYIILIGYWIINITNCNSMLYKHSKVFALFVSLDSDYEEREGFSHKHFTKINVWLLAWLSFRINNRYTVVCTDVHIDLHNYLSAISIHIFCFDWMVSDGPNFPRMIAHRSASVIISTRMLTLSSVQFAFLSSICLLSSAMYRMYLRRRRVPTKCS